MSYKRIGPFLKWILQTFMHEIFFLNYFSWVVLNIGMHPSSLVVTLFVLGVFEFVFLLIILSDQVIVVKYFRNVDLVVVTIRSNKRSLFKLYILRISFTTLIVVS